MLNISLINGTKDVDRLSEDDQDLFILLCFLSNKGKYLVLHLFQPENDVISLPSRNSFSIKLQLIVY